MELSAFVVCAIVLALAFDIVNGFHDAANSIATVVSTRVLSPRVAVLWAAGFNFVALLIASGHMAKDFHGVPWWIVASSYGCMALGTAMGGWRIVKTMGMRLTKLRPIGGFCAEIAGAVTLFAATSMHIPVSTTHTITGSIIGVGSTTRIRGIKWGLAGRIVWGWVFTIPLSAAMASIAFLAMRWLWLS